MDKETNVVLQHHKQDAVVAKVTDILIVKYSHSLFKQRRDTVVTAKLIILSWSFETLHNKT